MWYEKALVAYLSYAQTFGRPLPSINKMKGSWNELQFIDSDGQVDLTHLDVLDFFENPNGKIDHLIGDGIVRYN